MKRLHAGFENRLNLINEGLKEVNKKEFTLKESQGLFDVVINKLEKDREKEKTICWQDICNVRPARVEYKSNLVHSTVLDRTINDVLFLFLKDHCDNDQKRIHDNNELYCVYAIRALEEARENLNIIYSEAFKKVIKDIDLILPILHEHISINEMCKRVLEMSKDVKDVLLMYHHGTVLDRKFDENEPFTEEELNSERWLKVVMNLRSNKDCNYNPNETFIFLCELENGKIKSVEIKEFYPSNNEINI